MKPIDMVKMALGAAVVISVIYLAYEEFDDHPAVVGTAAGSAAALYLLNLSFIARAVGGGAA